MNLENFVIITKAWCLTTIPLVSTFGGGLATYQGDTVFHIPKYLVQLGCASYCAGAGGLLAFMSQSFGDFMAGRKNGNGNGNGKPPQPAAPTTGAS